uniref:BURP domain-containing protein n=1 Tax=Oryza brachyantha TaxID=4533 RepID=J3MYJ0_ORYBR
MASLLVLALAATALMVVQPGRQMTVVFAARTSAAAEAFWRAAMPGASMPDAILELLHHGEPVN